MGHSRRFSVGQATMIIVAVCFGATLIPVGVYAASSLVTIKDPSTSAKARVNSRGGLAVTQRDPVSGHQAKVGDGGHLFVDEGGGSLTVNGTVDAVTVGTTDLLFDGYPAAGTLVTPFIDTTGYGEIRINLDNGSGGSAPLRIFSSDAAHNSTTKLAEFSLAGFGFRSDAYAVPGEAIQIYAYGGVTNVHIQVFGRP